jgi:hypothetical protein
MIDMGLFYPYTESRKYGTISEESWLAMHVAKLDGRQIDMQLATGLTTICAPGTPMSNTLVMF